MCSDIYSLLGCPFVTWQLLRSTSRRPSGDDGVKLKMSLSGFNFCLNPVETRLSSLLSLLAGPHISAAPTQLTKSRANALFSLLPVVISRCVLCRSVVCVCVWGGVAREGRAPPGFSSTRGHGVLSPQIWPLPPCAQPSLAAAAPDQGVIMVLFLFSLGSRQTVVRCCLRLRRGDYSRLAL